jgi:toxin HigB-1
MKRLRLILTVLNELTELKDLEGYPGLRLHPLKGEYKGFWSVSVSGNWRVIFQCDGEDVFDVDYIDYH